MQTLFIYGVVAFIWTGYRLISHLPEVTDELIFKPLIFWGPVFGWVLVREKGNLSSLGFTTKNLKKSILIGAGLGLFFALEGVITTIAKDKEIEFNPGDLTTQGFILAGIISLTTGFSEEVLNRGFLMNRLWERWGSELWANLVSSILFMLFHLPMALFVLNYRGWEFFTFELLMFILGIADGFIFGRTKNVIAPAISHSIWNFSAILFR